mmetsp:Transcript_5420/g.9471  ORF Transcript_5420/g.9471 Transcript_5420/m.9471 type:complete len:388 (-) Transcript_5420:143-1306(-)
MYERGERQMHQKAPGAKKHIFYYVNYRHFVKLVRLRLHFMRKLIDQKEGEQTTSTSMYVCPRCNIEYDLLTAVACQDEESGMFFCERCKDDLDELVLLNEISSKTDNKKGEISSKDAEAKSLREKREEQMREEPGLRDGIEDIMIRIDNFPLPPPTNLPSDHIDNAEDAHREKLEEEKYGANGGGRGNSRHNASYNEAGQAVRVQIISYPDVDDVADAQAADIVDDAEVAGGQLPAWMQTDVTGKVSSSAIQDAKERQQKRGRLAGGAFTTGGGGLGGAAALLERQEGNRSSSMDLDFTPKLRRTESEQHLDSVREQTLRETVVSVQGASKPMSEVSREDENGMTDAEYGDYLDKWEKIVKWSGMRRPEEITAENEAEDEAMTLEFF